MGWTAGTWLPAALAMLQVAGLGLPCAVSGPGDAESHPGSAHMVAAGHSETSGHADASSLHIDGDAGDGSLNLRAACPCGCTGSSAVASPAGNLGHALLLDEHLPAVPVSLIALGPALPLEIEVSSLDIDHVPLRFG